MMVCFFLGIELTDFFLPLIVIVSLKLSFLLKASNVLYTLI